MKTYYEILGLDRKCGQKDVKKAYRRLVKRFHPDVNKDGAKVFEEIAQAYNTLYNIDKRKNVLLFCWDVNHAILIKVGKSQGDIRG